MRCSTAGPVPRTSAFPLSRRRERRPRLIPCATFCFSRRTARLRPMDRREGRKIRSRVFTSGCRNADWPLDNNSAVHYPEKVAFSGKPMSCRFGQIATPHSFISTCSSRPLNARSLGSAEVAFSSLCFSFLPPGNPAGNKIGVCARFRAESKIDRSAGDSADEDTRKPPSRSRVTNASSSAFRLPPWRNSAVVLARNGGRASGEGDASERKRKNAMSQWRARPDVYVIFRGTFCRAKPRVVSSRATVAVPSPRGPPGEVRCPGAE